MKLPTPQPPKWANRFLEWFCHPDLLEEIQGDAYELFYKRCKNKSPKAAKWHFIWDVCRSFRLSTIKNFNPSPIMLKYNFKIAFRQIKRQQFYSAINILGLALGVACCLLIALYIKDEMSYDKQHTNLDNLYRVALDINLNESVGQGNCVPPILPLALVEEIPEVVKAARINSFSQEAGSNLIRKETEAENQFEENFVYADQSLFELFDFPLLLGDKNTILKEPNTIVISQAIKEKYFPNKSPIGEKFVLNDSPNSIYKITGVLEKIPDQSHFKFDFFLSMPSLEHSKATQWVSNSYFAYVTLKEGTRVADLQQKLEAFSMRNFAPAFKKTQGLDLVEKAKEGQYYKVCLKPVRDIYLYSAGKERPQIGKIGDIQYVRLFSLIALFVFGIALINFINLSTARSANRAKEVGVRKVLGSFQQQLISQFLVESTLMSFMAFIVGGLLAYILLPFFSDLSGKNLSFPFANISFIIIYSCLAIGVGILAGLYPAFYLSSFQPIKVLKGKLSRGAKNGFLRNTLVVGQFAISIGLIIATITVYQQINFIQNQKIGFEKEQVLLIQDTYILKNQVAAFKKSLKDIPAIKNATMTSFLPLDGGRRNSMAAYIDQSDKRQEQLYIQAWAVDENYVPTLGMEMKEGRNFQTDRKNDALGVILNETAVRQFGLQNPLGKTLKSPYLEDSYTVLGVVKDFNFESVKGIIRPLAFFLKENNSVIAVKANTQKLEQLIQQIEQAWKSFAPTQPFRYTFLDDRFAKMYVTEAQVGKLFLIFSLLAIFIACLGLFAIATYMTEQRTKEIGIRKVLGASVPNIVFMLSKQFLVLVFIGLLFAAPIAWLQMDNWLNNFTYRINMQWWIFTIAGLSVSLIAFLTVGGQSFKAALANPINSLKSE